MRVLIILACALLVLTACDRESGKGLLGVNSDEDARQTAAITGQVIGDLYTQDFCVSDSDCGPGQMCVNENCVAQE